MIRQSLDGRWRLRQHGTDNEIPASVPGGVHLDLIAAGLIADPFVGENELDVQWVAEADWEYATTFEVQPDILAEERAFLVCDGLDTLAEVSLNGQVVATSDNMFRSYRWDVRDILRDGANELTVRFRSAVRAAAEFDRLRPLIAANDQLPGAPHLRKAPCHFGWDWGPKLPNVGIWQSVALEGASVGRLDDVRVEQRHDAGRISLDVSVAIERWADGALTLAAGLTHPDGRTQTVDLSIEAGTSTASFSVEVEQPQLWWPNGLGGQPLYRLEVSLADGSRVIDRRPMRVGLRTIELRQEPDSDGLGRSFLFVVNGVPVFAKGSNWIPADSFQTRAPQRHEMLLRAAADANQNMIRVWGGGYYEAEGFYDLCDRLGLLVWQDFMFACSVYPLDDPAFVENVRVEVEQQVRRLRHRACLALWCGNNEIEVAWQSWSWDTPENAGLKAAYREFFERTLPGWIAAGDSATAYWPSSPSSGKPFDEPVSDRSGDEHQWRVWHGLLPFSDYREKTYRFVSEFGFQSVPPMETVKAMAPDPADWNLGAPVLDHHQRSPIGNARILGYLGQHFRVPRDFESMVYLSQLLQAEAMRIGVEHWRRGRDRCGGALYWQLNDCWPVTSWSSIDYFGRWKAMHYAARRFFAPVLLSGLTEGGEARLWLTNDLPEPVEGELGWTLETLDGEVLASGATGVTAGVLATTKAGEVAAAIARPRRTVLVVEYACSRSWQQVVLPFVPDKHLELSRARPDILVAPHGDGARCKARLRSETLLRFVELSIEGADVVFSDNFFDLPAGRERTIDFDLPAGFDLDRVRSALRVRSLVDSY